MFNVNQYKLDKSNRRLLQDLPGALLVPLKFISDGLRLYKIFRWFQIEWLRYAMIRKLDRLNDDYLDDIGIKRKDIRPSSTRRMPARISSPSKIGILERGVWATSCVLGMHGIEPIADMTKAL